MNKIDKETLYRLYIVENKERIDIARMYNLSESSIKWYLRRYRIKKVLPLVLEEKTCKQCGKIFKERTKYFCSRECYHKYYEEHQFIMKFCEVCGKEFKIHKRDTKRTCSTKCAAKLQRITYLKNEGVTDFKETKAYKKAKQLRTTLESFIEQAKHIHGNDYNYSKVDYKGMHVKVDIICNNCKSVFKMTPQNHLAERGCPYCNYSKGEKKITKLLTENKITYIAQKRFKECRDKQPLPFDFYLPEYNLCIEFQGAQHYEEGFCFYMTLYKKDLIKAKKYFDKNQLHDQIKRDFCATNNIRLLEIRYDEDIEMKLKEYLALI